MANNMNVMTGNNMNMNNSMNMNNNMNMNMNMHSQQDWQQRAQSIDPQMPFMQQMTYNDGYSNSGGNNMMGMGGGQMTMVGGNMNNNRSGPGQPNRFISSQMSQMGSGPLRNSTTLPSGIYYDIF
jgi:hypothetical protein